MLFNSTVFLFYFLPFSFSIYFLLSHSKYFKGASLFLLLASLVFYSYWNIYYLPLILGSIGVNFLLSQKIMKASNIKMKKSLLTIGILLNIGLLFIFKYSDFFIENINLILDNKMSLFNLALPLAISFFTFQQIAYLVDSFHDKVQENNFINYSLFVTFFPQLIAGPIVHHKEMMPQFQKPENRYINYRNISIGLFIFSIGLFKKVVLADTFCVWVDLGFGSSSTLDFFEAWATIISFYFQLYFDFSGYTDMAIGLGLLFNIKLPINFNSPYKSTSIIELWSKWHMTLSTFVNIYVFKPLLHLFGSYSFLKAMFALFTSMLIIGIWHGASWMFVLFGLVHAIAIVINHTWKKKVQISLPNYVGWSLTFLTIIVSMVFFRSTGISESTELLTAMFTIDTIHILKLVAELLNSVLNFSFFTFTASSYKYIFSLDTFVWIVFGFGFYIVLYLKNSNQIIEDFKFKKYQAFFIVFSLVCFYFLSIEVDETPFLYFVF